MKVYNIIRSVRLKVIPSLFPNDTVLGENSLAWGARSRDREVTARQRRHGRVGLLVFAPPIRAVGLLVLLEDLKSLKRGKLALGFLLSDLLFVKLRGERRELALLLLWLGSRLCSRRAFISLSSLSTIK